MEITNTFLGFFLSQEWQDFPVWEAFFRLYPVRTFVELGTGKGGMTTYFALQCFKHNINFQTYDHEKLNPFDDPLSQFLGLAGRFHHIDLFSPEGIQSVATHIELSAKPIALFFDDGNKPREWQIFAPLTSPGDFCVVHDWGTEFKPEDIGGVRVEQILTEMCNLRGPGWKSMWFQRY